MEVAVRSYLASGVALVGAGVIAVSPIVPKPHIELPAVPVPHISAAVDLAALENPLQVIAELIQQSVANATALGGNVLANPAPILEQILKNQIANVGELAGDLQAIFAGTGSAITQAVPQQIQMALEAFSQGQITNGLDDLLGAVLLPLLGNGLSNLAPIQDIFAVLAKPVENLANVITAGSTIVLNAGIAPVQVLSNFINAIGPGAEGLIAAIQTGNPVNVANAVIDGVAGIAGAAINSVIDPNSGLVATVLNIRNLIAQALGAPVALVAKVAAVNELPAAAAKTVTLSTTSTASATGSAATASKGDAKPSDSTTSDKDAGSTDTKSGSPTKSDESSTATDSSATGSSATGSGAAGSSTTESKSGTDTGKDTDSGKGATTGKDDSSGSTGAASDSSSASTPKTGSGTTKTSTSGSGADKSGSEKAGEKSGAK
jgi:hypothetical protein